MRTDTEKIKELNEKIRDPDNLMIICSRHPTESEISEHIRFIFKVKLNFGTITTKQYRSFKGMCKSKKKASERCIRNWFMKNDPDTWKDIEKYMNSMITYEAIDLLKVFPDDEMRIVEV